MPRLPRYPRQYGGIVGIQGEEGVGPLHFGHGGPEVVGLGGRLGLVDQGIGLFLFRIDDRIQQLGQGFPQQLGGQSFRVDQQGQGEFPGLFGQAAGAQVLFVAENQKRGLFQALGLPGGGQELHAAEDLDIPGDHHGIGLQGLDAVNGLAVVVQGFDGLERYRAQQFLKCFQPQRVGHQKDGKIAEYASHADDILTPSWKQCPNDTRCEPRWQAGMTAGGQRTSGARNGGGPARGKVPGRGRAGPVRRDGQGS